MRQWTAGKQIIPRNKLEPQCIWCRASSSSGTALVGPGDWWLYLKDPVLEYAFGMFYGSGTMIKQICVCSMSWLWLHHSCTNIQHNSTYLKLQELVSSGLRVLFMAISLLEYYQKMCICTTHTVAMAQLSVLRLLLRVGFTWLEPYDSWIQSHKLVWRFRIHCHAILRRIAWWQQVEAWDVAEVCITIDLSDLSRGQGGSCHNHPHSHDTRRD